LGHIKIVTTLCYMLHIQAHASDRDKHMVTLLALDEDKHHPIHLHTVNDQGISLIALIAELATLSMEKTFIKNLSNFYNLVLNNFAESKERKVDNI